MKNLTFDRREYLDLSDVFEAGDISDVDSEMCEFSNDAEDLAYELAYTRYALAKIENAIELLNEAI